MVYSSIIQFMDGSVWFLLVVESMLQLHRSGVSNLEVEQNLNTTWSKVDFVLSFCSKFYGQNSWVAIFLWFDMRYISKKIAQFSAPNPFGPEKCPVYLRALWIGSAIRSFQQLDHQRKTAVENCYRAVSPRWVFSSQCMLPQPKRMRCCATCQPTSHVNWPRTNWLLFLLWNDQYLIN